MYPIKWLQNLVCLLVVITSTALVFVPANTAAQDIEGTKEIAGQPNSISVAYCADCVPFHFQDEQGQPAGMIIDLWRLWSEKTGIKVDYRVASWDDTLAMVSSGAADAHAGLFFNKERDKLLDYGAALRKTDTHVFIHKNLPAISRLEDLSAYRIGVLAEDYVEGYLKERLPNAVIVPFPDYASIMAALKDGTLRVFAADTPTGIYHLQHSGLVEGFAFSKDLLLYQNDWFAAAQDGNASLIKIINIGMAQISRSEKTEVGRRWSGSNKEEKTDVLLIAMDRAYPPMTFLNAQGSPAGFLVDLWRLWSEKTGRQIRFRENSLKESLESLRSGEADVHAGIFKNDEREQWLGFGTEVYQIKTGLYHRVGSSIPDDLTLLGEQSLGVIAGSHQETMARTRWPNLQLTPFDTAQELIQTLLKGEVVAVIVEVPVMDVLLDQMGMRGEITLKSDQILLNSVHPAVLKEHKEVLSLIEQGFALISQGEFGELEKRWIVDPEKRVFFKPMREAKSKGKDFSLSRSVMGMAILILFLVFAVFMLKRYLKTAQAKDSSGDLFQSTKVFAIGIGVIGLFLVMTIILTWVAIDQVDQRIRQDTGTNLNNALKSTQNSLRMWVDSNKSSLAQLLIQPELLKSAEVLLALPRSKDVLVKNLAQESMREFFKTRLEVSNKGGFFVIAPDFISIASRRDTNIGTTNLIAQQKRDLIRRVFRGEIVLVPPIYSDISFEKELGGRNTSEPTMFFVGPLKNNRGEVIAAVSLRIDPFKDFSRMTHDGRIGESGETYAFNQVGYFLTESRFKGQMEKLGLVSKGMNEVLTAQVSDPGGNLVEGFKEASLTNSRPLTLMAQSATQGLAATNIQGYRDYRGVPVLGTWLWDDALGLGLASEIDAEEALGSFYITQKIIISVVLVIIFLILGFSYWLAKHQKKLAGEIVERKEAERTLKENQKSLEQANKEMKYQNWLKTGLNQLNESMQGEQKLFELGNNILSSIKTFLKLPMGAIFILTPENLLNRMACQGYPENKSDPFDFQFGEGFIGQVALKGEPIAIDDIPKSHFVSFGFGEVPPKSVLAYPLKYNDDVVGVLELISFDSFTEDHMEWIEEASKIIAIGIHTKSHISENQEIA